MELELIREDHRVDLVDDLFDFVYECREGFLLRSRHRGNHILNPDLDQHLKNVNVINQLGEAGEDHTATWLLVAAHLALGQAVSSVVAISAHEHDELFLYEAGRGQELHVQLRLWLQLGMGFN